MKKNLFLVRILAALLTIAVFPSCSDPVQLTDAEPKLDVGSKNWRYMYTDTYTGKKYACYQLNVLTQNATISNGGWSGLITIKENMALTVAPDCFLLQETDNPEGTPLWNIIHKWGEDYRLHITMEASATLNYANRDLWLGTLNFTGGTDKMVTINAAHLVARDIRNCTRAFSINTQIDSAPDSHLGLQIWNQYTSSVDLKCNQRMELEVKRGDDASSPRIVNGQIVLGQEDCRSKLNGNAITLPSSSVNRIEGYLGGGATIYLEGGATLSGLYDDRGYGQIAISWLRNNVVVKSGLTAAVMKGGYYGGTITLEEGSSLMFDMRAAPSGGGSDWDGGAKFILMGRSTLDLCQNGVYANDVKIAGGEEVTIKNGKILSNLTLKGQSLALWNVSLYPEDKVYLEGDATLNLLNQAFEGKHLSIRGNNNTITNGSIIGGLLALKDAGLTLGATVSTVSLNGNVTLNISQQEAMALLVGGTNSIQAKAGLNTSQFKMMSGSSLTVGGNVSGVQLDMENNSRLTVSGDLTVSGSLQAANFSAETCDISAQNILLNTIAGTAISLHAGRVVVKGAAALSDSLVVTGENAASETITFQNSLSAGKSIVLEGKTITGDGGNFSWKAPSMQLNAQNSVSIAGTLQGRAVNIAAGGDVTLGAMDIAGDGSPQAAIISTSGSIVLDAFNAGDNGKLSVKAGDKIRLGPEKSSTGEIFPTFRGNVEIVSTGSRLELQTYDVLLNCTLAGNVTVNAPGKWVFLYQLVDEGKDVSAAIDANHFHAGALIGKDLTLRTSQGVDVVGDIEASGAVQISGLSVESNAGDIQFGRKLIAGTSITLRGENIKGGSLLDEQRGVSAQNYLIEAQADISISSPFLGGGQARITSQAGNITLDAVGVEQNAVETAEIAARLGGIEFASFHGDSLYASAGDHITIRENAVASGTGKWAAGGDSALCAIVLEGGGVTAEGTIAANQGCIHISGGTGGITVGGALSSGKSISLVSAADISVQNLVQGGSLTATAAGSISLKSGLGSKEAQTAMTAELAAKGDVTLGSFIGDSLQISATKAVALNGSVEASGAGEMILLNGDATPYAILLDGGSVTARSIAAKQGNVFICGNTGGIALEGALEFGPSATLVSAAGISINDKVQGGMLKASATGDLILSGDAVVTDPGVWGVAGNAAPYAVALEGGSVQAQAITAEKGGIHLQSLTSGITLEGVLNSGESITLLSAADIAAQAVTCASLTANAAGSISWAGGLGSGGGKAPMAADLIAQGGGITLESFTGGSLKGSARDAVTIVGNVVATGTVDWTRGGDSAPYAVVLEGGSVTAQAITATRGDIYVGSSAGAIAIAGGININSGDTQTQLNAELEAQRGSITLASFTGASLKGTARDAVTIGGNVVASGTGNWIHGWDASLYAVVLEGGSVTAQAITAHQGNVYIGGGSGGITLQGELCAAKFTTLESAADITIKDKVQTKSLTATAAGSVSMQDGLGTGDDPYLMDANLTAQTGSIGLYSFTGGSLKACAMENVTISAGVDASGPDRWAVAGDTALYAVALEGARVEVNGSITAEQGGIHIRGGSGGIMVDGSLSAYKATTLLSKGDITVTGKIGDAYLDEFVTATARGIITFAESVNIAGSKEQAALISAGEEVRFVNKSIMLGSAVSLVDTTLRAPKVSVDRELRGSCLTMTGGTDGSTVQVSLRQNMTLEDGSLIQGDVTFTGTNLARLTVKDSTITGMVSGLILQLQDATIGGAEGCHQLTFEGATNKITGDLVLGNNIGLGFSLGSGNITSPCLTIGGDMKQADAEAASCGITLYLQGKGLVEGEQYALISMASHTTPKVWESAQVTVNSADPFMTKESLVWQDGTLYVQYGPVLVTATWTGGADGVWGGAGKNWIQNGRLFSYKDGVDVVFNDTGEVREVRLEGELAPKGVLVNSSVGHDYIFKGIGKIVGQTALTKEGDGMLTIGTANGYTGGTIVRGGMLVMANPAALGTGAATLEGGSLNLGGNTIANDVILVSGKANVDNGTLAGNLTLADGVNFTWHSGNLEITGGVILNADSRFDLNGKAIANATLAGSGAVIENGAVTGNLTLADGETYSWAALGSKGLTISGGITLGNATALDLDGHAISNAVSLRGSASLGGGTLNGSLSVNPGNTLSLSGNLDGTGDIILDNAALNLGSYILSNKVTLKGSAAIGGGTLNGELHVAAGQTLSLSGNLGGTGDISLANAATLNLGGCILSNKVTLKGSAALGGGTLNGALSVASGETLTLCGNLGGTGNITLANNAALDLGSHILNKGVSLTGDAGMGGGTYNGALDVAEGQTLTLCGNLGGTGDISLANSATLNLGGYTLDKGFTLKGSAAIGGGTYNGTFSVSSGETLTLGGNLDGTGNISLANAAKLDLGSHILDKGVSLIGNATLGGGTLNGALDVATNQTLTLCGNLDGADSIILRHAAKLDLGGHTISKDITLTQDAVIGNGIVAGNLILEDGVTFSAHGSSLQLKGGAILGTDSHLNLSGNTIANATLTDSASTIENGTVSGILSLTHGVAYTWGSNNLSISGTIALRNGATLDLAGGARNFNLDVTGAGNTIMNGSFAGNATIADGELALQADMDTSAGVIMQGGATLDLAGKERKFRLTVTGTENTLKNGSFLGSLTLEEGSRLSSDSAMCSWAGPESIVMNNGSTLEMVGQDFWINNLSALKVNGTATINGAYLRVRSVLAPDRVYTLGNGVENLKGEGTYYVLTGDDCWDHFDLNGKSVNFGIIVWDAEKESDIVISNGTIDKSVEIRGYWPGRPYSKLKLQNVTLGSNATFTMGDGAVLDLGGAEARFAGFTFTGDAATVDNGKLRVGNKETATLGGNLSGTANVYLGDKAALNLNGHTLGNSVILENSATIGGGTLNGTLSVGSGETLTLGGNLDGTGAINLRSFSNLNLDNHVLCKNVNLYGYATINAGAINGNVQISGDDVMLILRGDLAGEGVINLEKSASLDLGGHTLSMDIILGNSTSRIENGTVAGNLHLTTGASFICFDDLQITGLVTLEAQSSLDLNGQTINAALLTASSPNIHGGTVKNLVLGNRVDYTWEDTYALQITDCVTVGEKSGLNLNGKTINAVTLAAEGAVVVNGTVGSLTLADGVSLIWSNDTLKITGGVILGANSQFDLYGQTIANATLSGNGATVLNGTVTGNFTMADGETYSWAALGGKELTISGGITLGNATALDLDGHAISNAISLKGSASLGGGTLNSALSVASGETLTLCGNLDGTGNITLANNAALNLGGSTLSKGVELAGNATLGGGVQHGNLFVGSGSTLTLCGNLDGTGTITLESGATLNLGGNTLTKSINVTGSSSITGGGSLNGTVSMGDGAQLDLGLAAARLGGFTFTGQSAVVDNGTLSVGNGETVELGVNLSGTAFVTLANNAALNLGGHTLGNAVILNGSASISNGTLDGDLILGNGVSCTWPAEKLQFNGWAILGSDATLDLGGKSINAALLTAASSNIRNGTVSASLKVADNVSYIWRSENLQVEGVVILGNNAALDLDGHQLDNTVTLAGSASIGNGALNGALSVGRGNTLTLSGILTGEGAVTLEDGSMMNLGGNLLSKGIYVAGSALMEGGTLNGAVAVGDGTGSLSLQGATIGENATFIMGNGAQLNLGGAAIGLYRVAFTGESAAVDGGTLTVGSGETAMLGGNLAGTAGVSLGDKAVLNLNNFTLSNTVTLAGSASIGNGTLNGALSVGDGQTLNLSGNLNGGAVVSLETGSTLNLGGYKLGKNVVLKGAATIRNGILSGNLALADGVSYTWSDTGLQLNGGIDLGANSALDLGGRTLTRDITLNGSGASIRNGKLNGNLILGDGVSCTWPAGDLQLNGWVVLGSDATLDLGGKSINAALLTAGTSNIRNGTVSASLALANDVSYTWSDNDLQLTGGIILRKGSRFDLNNKSIATATLTSDISVISNGTITANLTLEDNVSYTWDSDALHIAGTVTLGNGAALNLGGHALENAVLLDGSATIGNGTLNGTLSVGAGQALRLSGALSGDGCITLKNDAALDLGKQTLNNTVMLEGSATIGNGTLNSNLYVAAACTLTLSGNLAGSGNLFLDDFIILDNQATLDLNAHTLDGAVSLEGSATMGGGALNGILTVSGGKTLTLGGDLTGTGEITLGASAGLALNGHTLGKAVTLASASATIGGGTLNGALTVGSGSTLKLSGDLAGSGVISLGDNTALNLNRHTLGNAVILEGDATIGNGSLDSDLAVGAEQTLKLSGDLAGKGGISLGDDATLNLNRRTLGKNVTMEGDATIGGGTITGTLSVVGGKTLTLDGNLKIYSGIDVRNGHTIDLDGKTLEASSVKIADNTTLTLDGTGTLAADSSIAGGSIIKVGEGGLNMKATVNIGLLDVREGDISVTGTADAKGNIVSLKAAVGTTVELVHTEATTANAWKAYQGCLVIGNGSTVTASADDGWACDTDNTLTVQTGGKLDMGNYRWTISPHNKITLAGGEIAGWGSDTYGALDFFDSGNVVAVTEDSTLSARLRVRGSVAFDVTEGKELSFSGGIVSSGMYDDDKGTVSKTGAGTMIMSGANAMPHGTINIQAGTLKVTGNSNPLGAATVNVTGGATLELGGTLAPAGTVTLAGGSLALTTGSKDFALKATGKGNLLNANEDSMFIGSLEMQDGALLEMAMGEGKNNWIDDISRLSVDGEATLTNAYLRIKESYTLGNGVENLKGEGATAYCMDGSTFNLNGNTTNLGIIVEGGQTNRLVSGKLGTTVDIRSGSKLTVQGLTIGDGGAFLMGDKACLDMSNLQIRLGAFSFTGAAATIDNGTLTVGKGETVQLGTNLQGTAAVSLDKEAVLDLNRHTLNSGTISLAADSASIGNGTLDGTLSVGAGQALILCGDLSGSGAVTLAETAALNLGNHVLGKAVTLAGSASIGNGTIDSAVNIDYSSKLTLQGVTVAERAAFNMGNNTKLDLGGTGVRLTGFTFTGGSAMVDNGTLFVGSGEMVKLGAGLSGTVVLELRGGKLDMANHSLSMGAMRVAGDAVLSNGVIDKAVEIIDEAYAGATCKLTLENVAVGYNATFAMGNNAQLALGGATARLARFTFTGESSVLGGGKLLVESGDTVTLGSTLWAHETDLELQGGSLDLNGKTLSSRGGRVTGDACMGGGSLNGSLAVDAGKTFTLCGDLAGEGTITLADNATLAPDTHKLDKGVILQGSATIGTGTQNGALTVASEKTLMLSGNLDGAGTVTLNEGTTLALGNHQLDKAVALAGSATIGTGTQNGALSVDAGKTLTLGGNLGGTGGVTLNEGTALALDGHQLAKDVTLAGSATIGTGTQNGSLSVDAGKTLTLGGNLGGTGDVYLGDTAVLNLNDHTLAKGVTLEGSASIGGGALNGILTVGGGKTLTLGGDLTGSGSVSMSKDGALNLNGHILDNDVSLTGDAAIGGGTLNGSLSVDCDQKLTLNGNLAGSGSVTLGGCATLDLGGHTLDNAVILKDSVIIGGGTLNGALSVASGQTLSLCGNLSGSEAVSLADWAILDLSGHTLDKTVALEGSAVISGGTLNSALSLGDETALAIYGDLSGTGTVSLGRAAILYLVDQTLSKDIYATQEATIYYGKLDGGNLEIKGGTGKVTLEGVVLGDSESFTMGDGAQLDLGGATARTDKFTFTGQSATIGRGKLSGNLAVEANKTLRLGLELDVAGDVTLNSTATISLGSGCSVEGTISGSGTIVKENGGTASVSGGMQGFTGSLEVQGGVLNLMNASSLEVQDVTLGAGSTLGVFKGGDSTPETAKEGTLTIRDAKALTAGKNATLNANLVMESGSTLDVSATEGQGLRLGSSLTLMQDISLSSLDLENVYGLTEGASYNLFSGVDALTMADKTYTEPFTPDVRIDAAGWFRGVDAEHIYVTYDGSNVGLYCMVPMPEPTTSTLSLLALAALAARRRRK